MAEKQLPLPSYIRQLFDYQDGVLVWNSRPLGHFKNKHGCNIWNAKNAGRVAGCMAQVYRIVTIEGRNHLLHRVIWAWHNGEWPAHEIDHINGNKLDNRIENLRDVPRQENARNLPVRNAKHGVVGVSQRGERWCASISVSDRTVYLGTFDKFSDAAEARRGAEQQYGFHTNHGRI